MKEKNSEKEDQETSYNPWGELAEPRKEMHKEELSSDEQPFEIKEESIEPIDTTPVPESVLASATKQAKQKGTPLKVIALLVIVFGILFGYFYFTLRKVEDVNYKKSDPETNETLSNEEVSTYQENPLISLGYQDAKMEFEKKMNINLGEYKTYEKGQGDKKISLEYGIVTGWENSYLIIDYYKRVLGTVSGTDVKEINGITWKVLSCTRPGIQLIGFTKIDGTIWYLKLDALYSNRKETMEKDFYTLLNTISIK